MEEKEVHSTEIYPVGNFDWPVSTNGVTVIGEEPAAPEKTMYRFFVGDIADIDIPRICREAEEDGRDVLLVPGQGGKGLLLVKASFLQPFTFTDGLTLAGEGLASCWGSRGTVVFRVRGGILFDRYADMDTIPSASIVKLEDGWRCKIIVLNQVPTVVSEIKKARRYHRRIQVKVHYL